MKSNTQRWYGLSAALFALLLFMSLLAYVGWKIAGSNVGIAGGSPGAAIAGELPDAKLRSMEQWCTGVVKTSSDVWLVGRTETRSDSDAFSDILADSTALGSPDVSAAGSRGGFSHERYLTTISRLQSDGTFKVEATVSDIACLIVAPKSEALYLVTWMKRPDTRVIIGVDGNPIKQDMVFRSTDHGHTWEWIESGFMTEATSLGASLKPIFASDQDIWVWGDAPDRYSPMLGTGTGTGHSSRNGEENRQPTRLFYSSDTGQTADHIYSREALEASDELLLSLTDENNPDSLQRFPHDTKRFVVQIDDVRAYAWLADLAWYHYDDGGATRLTMTTRAELVRSDPNEPWTITQITRIPHMYLDHVTTSADNQTHAILRNKEGEWLVRLDTQSGEWVSARATPTLLPEWLVGNRMNVRYFWSNGDYQVISLWGDMVVPRILFPFTEKPASITTNGHFYTDDGGRTWHQLAIPGYLGVLGLANHDAELFWSKGNWYSNQEPYVWRYDLSK